MTHVEAAQGHVPKHAHKHAWLFGADLSDGSACKDLFATYDQRGVIL